MEMPANKHYFYMQNWGDIFHDLIDCCSIYIYLILFAMLSSTLHKLGVHDVSIEQITGCNHTHTIIFYKLQMPTNSIT